MKRTSDANPTRWADAKRIESLPAAAHERERVPESSDEGASLADRLANRGLPTRRKLNYRKWLAYLAVIGVIAGIVWIAYRVFAPSHALRINVSTKQAGHSIDGVVKTDKSADDVASEALAEVKTILAKPAASSSSAASAPAVARTQGTATPPPALSLPPETVAANNSRDTTDHRASQPANTRNQEHSIPLALDDLRDKPSASDLGSDLASAPSKSVAVPRSEIKSSRQTVTSSESGYNSPSRLAMPPIVLPSFGAVLPVRTLGKIYTLRSGTTIRLELTRYIAGEGWSLSKGTTLIGQVRGSEQDRAFIAITGFIDPTRDRFVKLAGEILGDDGGTGIRGKFHKLSSGWSRAFARVASTAVNVAGAVASSRISGQPVIITDAGSRAITPFSSEVDSSLLNQARGFVEVPAGAAGFG